MYRIQIHYLKRRVQPLIVWSPRSAAYFKNKSGLNVNLSKLFLTGDGTGLVDLMWRRTDSEFWLTKCDSYSQVEFIPYCIGLVYVRRKLIVLLAGKRA